MKANSGGYLVLSLDFELMWGVRDKRSLEDYGDAISAVHDVIPAMLDLFEKYGVRATFSTVGFLFHENWEELSKNIPDKLPSYQNGVLSPYTEQVKLGDEKYFFASSLIDEIHARGQEVGTHTYSHYYCLEKGQDIEEFRSDLQMAKKLAEQKGIVLKSLVFPRNQFNKEYLSVCEEFNVLAFRGNPDSWLYVERNQVQESLMRRAIRLIDSYFNISGHHIYEAPQMQGGLYNVKASRFLRPYSSRLSLLEGLKRKRVKKGIRAAARSGKVFHLWWHPHNFGRNTQRNLSDLEDILLTYTQCKEKYGMRSCSMADFIKDQPT